MTAMELPSFMVGWPVWAVLLLLVGLPAFRITAEFGRWFAGFVSGRHDASSKSKTTAQEQFEAARRELMQQMQADLNAARSTLQSYDMELSKLRRVRSALQEAMIDVRTAAVAARAMVHDLERRLHDPLTVFTPLPPLEDL